MRVIHKYIHTVKFLCSFASDGRLIGPVMLKTSSKFALVAIFICLINLYYSKISLFTHIMISQIIMAINAVSYRQLFFYYSVQADSLFFTTATAQQNKCMLFKCLSIPQGSTYLTSNFLAKIFVIPQ